MPEAVLTIKNILRDICFAPMRKFIMRISLFGPLFGPLLGLCLIFCLKELPAHALQESQTPQNTLTEASKLYGKLKGIRKESPEKLKLALQKLNEQNFEGALTILEELGEKGSADAYFHLGEIERLGILPRGKNLSLAITNYRMASALGHKRAGLSLANMMYFDRGIFESGQIKDKPSVETAVATWQQLALEGEREALYMLGIFYWNGTATLMQDPIRGYGLIWLAANKGYKDAIVAEPQMLPSLSYDARMAGRDYAGRIDQLGFSKDPLRLDLIYATISPASTTGAKRKKPISWSLAWHLQIGISLPRESSEKLRLEIERDFSPILSPLHGETVADIDRIERYKLLYGPMKSMNEAVTTCLTFKKRGIDCFAIAPK